MNITGISDDGSQLLAETFGSISNTRNISVFGQPYLLGRVETGWDASPLDAPFLVLPDYRVEGVSADFQNSIWFADAAGKFTRDLYVGPPAAALTRMGPGAPPGVRIGELRLVGASDELNHVLLVDHSPNGEEENRLWPGDTTIEGRKSSLYEYVGTGNSEPRLVGISDVGLPSSVATSHLISNCGTVLGSLPEGEAYNAVSASGATIFFTAKACGSSPAVNELYARFNGERAVAISEPSASMPGRKCTGVCATAEHKGGVFEGASLDGSKVFFTTSQPLVDDDTDSGIDLYMAEIEEGTLTRMIQVSRGDIGDSTPGSGANVLGVARVSEDGSRVYFVAKGALTGANMEGKTPKVGEPNLYLFTTECHGGETACGNPEEHISFVATLSTQDEEEWSTEDFRPVQTTAPDGRFLVFQSTADLTSDEEGREEASQVFEYDAQTKTLVRVSKGQNGYNEDGNTNVYPATIPIQFYVTSSPENRFIRLAMSKDGARVFFSSYDALTPQALEGFNNIYEYHDGNVSLISDGHDVRSVEGHPATQLIGTDASGRDVFFKTADPLVPQAGDTLVGVYDARINGGLEQPSADPNCSDDACQGALASTLQLLASPTSSSGGESALPVVSITSARKPSLKPSKKAKPKRKKKHRKKSVRKTRNVAGGRK